MCVHFHALVMCVRAVCVGPLTKSDKSNRKESRKNGLKTGADVLPRKRRRHQKASPVAQTELSKSSTLASVSLRQGSITSPPDAEQVANPSQRGRRHGPKRPVQNSVIPPMSKRTNLPSSLSLTDAAALQRLKRRDTPFRPRKIRKISMHLSQISPLGTPFSSALRHSMPSTRGHPAKRSRPSRSPPTSPLCANLPAVDSTRPDAVTQLKKKPPLVSMAPSPLENSISLLLAHSAKDKPSTRPSQPSTLSTSSRLLQGGRHQRLKRHTSKMRQLIATQERLPTANTHPNPTLSTPSSSMRTPSVAASSAATTSFTPDETASSLQPVQVSPVPVEGVKCEPFTEDTPSHVAPSQLVVDNIHDSDVFLIIQPRNGPPNPAISYYCRVCNGRIVLTDNGHWSHSRTPQAGCNNESPGNVKRSMKIPCIFCGALLSSRGALYNHIKTTHKRKVGKHLYYCDLCHKGYKSSLSLWRHLRIHLYLGPQRGRSIKQKFPLMEKTADRQSSPFTLRRLETELRLRTYLHMQRANFVHIVLRRRPL